MKICILGDIHGRTIWKQIIEKENPDKIIFLGDYVATHDNISAAEQINNLNEILSYKEDNSDKVILLRGNHDVQHLGYYWASCSGLNYEVYQYMSENSFKEHFLNLTQWIYIDENLKTIFSHAGISSVWMNNAHVDNIYNINQLKPSELFAFIPDSLYDYYGNSVTQPPVWIRPQTLCTCNIKDWDQVVGHTPVKQDIINMKESTKYKRNIWLCDALGINKYLIINNGIFIPSKL